MNCNYKVKLDDIQNKYKFNIFCTGSYNDSDLRKMIESVFYALPRVNGSGTSVTLTDTAFSYMKNKLYAIDISQEGEPTTDAPQTIHTISGDNTINVTGKNLLPNKIQTNTIHGVTCTNNGDGTVTLNGTATAKTYFSPFYNDFISLSLDGNYTFSANTYNNISYALYHGSAELFFWNTKSDKTFSATGSFDKVRPQINIESGVTLNNVIVKFQLEKGSTATEYEPYQGSQYSITLGDKEICKIGNYEDKIFKAIKGNEIYDSLSSKEKNTLNYGKWYLRKAIGKVVLDGSENWNSILMPNCYGYYYQQTNIVSPSSDSVVGLGLCDYYSIVSPRANWETTSGNKNYCIINTSSSTAYIRFTNGEITNELNAFKTWLGTNKPILYYVLASPTNELFNDTIQDQLEDIYNNMLSYEGQTNVSQVNDDLPFNINSTAIKDLNNL